MPATYHKYSWFVYLHVKFFFFFFCSRTFRGRPRKTRASSLFLLLMLLLRLRLSLSLFSSRSENWIFSKAELAAATACQRSCCCRRRGCRLTSRLGSFSATTAHPPSRSRLTRRRRLLLRTPAHNAHTTPEGVSVFQKQNTQAEQKWNTTYMNPHRILLAFPNFYC